MAHNLIPNPNRYITDNDADGGSFYSTDLPTSIEVGSNLSGQFQRLGYQTAQPPVSLSNNDDLTLYKTALQSEFALITPGGGAKVWYNDLPPESESPMHRTVSLDIVIVVVGEVELTLSNDETRMIKPGDMVVQRSTMHKWRNPSKTHWVRIIAIVSECQPYVTEKGEALGAHFSSS